MIKKHFAKQEDVRNISGRYWTVFTMSNAISGLKTKPLLRIWMTPLTLAVTLLRVIRTNPQPSFVSMIHDPTMGFSDYVCIYLLWMQVSVGWACTRVDIGFVRLSRCLLCYPCFYYHSSVFEVDKHEDRRREETHVKLNNTTRQ